MRAFTAILLMAVVIAGMTGCQPAAANNTSAPATQPTATEAPATATPAPTPPPTEQPTPSPAPWQTVAGPQDFDMSAESVGSVRLGLTESELVAILGQPESKSEPSVWGSDDMEHVDWEYKAKGFTINLSKNPDSKDEAAVFSISASAPCAWATQRGVKVGDAKDAVLTVYADAINPDDSSENEAVAGSMFGGVMFHFENGLVSTIFIGAAAE